MRLLDLFCGAGGAAMGYHRAGFTEIVGVDNRPQKRYPFEFVLGDALEYCRKYGHLFDVVSGGPPCQLYSVLFSLSNGDFPDLIASTREAMIATGRPYIIENVPRAPLINPIKLCGTMFEGLRVIRHRLFECSPTIWFPPGPCQHWGVASASGRGKGKNKSNAKGYIAGTLENFDFITVVGNDYIVASGRAAMGIDWMTGRELSQAIPPAYTEWLGKQMLKLI
jgi:DNA (cytosine-5)-methyltransferase 1